MGKHAKRDPDHLISIYKSFPEDVDTKAVHSKKRVQREWHREKISAYKTYLPLDGKEVLDVGCGSGGVSFEIIRTAGFKRYVGVDFNDDAIKSANARNKRKDVKFIASHAEKLPFKDGEFDSLLLSDVLDHCYDYKSCLKEARRVLRNGGQALVTVENKHSLWPIVEAVWDRFGDSRNYGDTHLEHFSPGSLRKALEEQDFRVRKIFTVHNTKPFFHIVSGWYPKHLDRWTGRRCLGMTLCAVVEKK
ncbi:MAG: class I SAM-dependent methyltransferase [archaeon]